MNRYMNRYSIAGDGTGKTYGIYKHEAYDIYKHEDGEHNPFKGIMIVSGLKSIVEAQKKIRELEEAE